MFVLQDVSVGAKAEKLHFLLSCTVSTTAHFLFQLEGLCPTGSVF